MENEKKIADQEPIQEKPVPKKNKMGTVINCELLNVRSIPTIDGIVYGVIPKGTKVKIDDSKSTGSYYSISIKDGINGFCMKQYIQVY